MDKATVPVLPEYLKRIVDSLDVRGSKVATSLPQRTGSQENIQLQGGNEFGGLGDSVPMKVKERILENPILALGKYSSLIKSNTYHIEIQFLVHEF